MKKFVCGALLSLLWGACTTKETQATAQAVSPLRVMSFNVRYDNPDDGEHNWHKRKERVANAIHFYEPDLLGTQEVLHGQMEDLCSRLTDYESVGVGREDGNRQGEYAALWFRKDRFELLSSGHFWLSETPDVPGSKGWDGACERMASWARLKDKQNGNELLFMNTHLDHVGQAARSEGVKLLMTKAAELGQGIPVVLTGDFNAEPTSSVIAALTDSGNPHRLVDARTASPLVYGPAWSYHDFETLPYANRPLIDYIFLSRTWKVTKFGVLAEHENGALLSDHAPVLAVIVPE